MTETEKLLAVLDMTEEEQQKWWETNYGEKFGCKNCLAFEAFRLRHEVKEMWIDWGVGSGRQAWGSALQEVYCFVTKKPWDGIEFREWFVYKAQPIHWIIAALIAKRLAKKE